MILGRVFILLNNKIRPPKGFHRSGFTLIGLTMTIVIIGVILPAIYAALVNPILNSGFEYNQTKALALAQEKMEEIFSAKASSSILLGYDYITEANYPDESSISGFPGFTRSVSVTELVGNDLSTVSAGSGFKRVIVNVTWDNGGSSVSLTNILGDY